MNLPLQTKRLILRRFRETDLADFVAYRSDPKIAYLQTWDETYSLKDAQAFLAYQKKNEA